MMGRQYCAAVLKITLTRGQLKCKKGRMMRTCLSCMQPHHHGVILRHLLNMVNSFLCSSTNYFENRLLSNDLIIVRNYGDGEDTLKLMRRSHTESNFDILGLLGKLRRQTLQLN
jgi:hypothetical protein